MKQVYVHSHLGGEEILLVKHPEINDEINAAIEGVPNPGRGKISREKTKRGRELFSPTEIERLFRAGFEERGWTRVRDYYDIELPGYAHAVEGACRDLDYCKPPVFVEVQFGEQAFMFYDLAKFQYFRNQGQLQVVVEIVPCHLLQQQMSSGVSYGEQLVNDLARLQGNFPSVPVKIILVDMPLDDDSYAPEERQRLHEDHEAYMNRIEERMRELRTAEEP
jgi:hypothetical protein